MKSERKYCISYTVSSQNVIYTHTHTHTPTGAHVSRVRPDDKLIVLYS